VGLVILLSQGLYKQTPVIPSVLISKPLPFLGTLTWNHTSFHQQDLLGHFTLVHVWASWCEVCDEEHYFFLKLKKNANLILLGLNYGENEEAIGKFIKKRGNPYSQILLDKQLDSAFVLGVYGVPESFLINPRGIIFYKHVGPLSASLWEKEIGPVIIKEEGYLR
jgi:cytochrome c biogenesis protein CcmG/thiol:disulfide interchange protein DsbE